jgi:hypothetical protein
LYSLDVRPLYAKKTQDFKMESIFTMPDIYIKSSTGSPSNGKIKSNSNTPEKIPKSPDRIKFNEHTFLQKVKIIEGNETRAFMIPMDKLNFDDFVKKISSEYKSPFKLSYLDEEGDLISILTEDDFQEALHFFYSNSTPSIKFQILKSKTDHSLQDTSLFITPSSVTPKSNNSPKPEKIVSPPSPMPKTTFNWQKGGLLGSGSSGDVYMALNVENGEPMAVKMIPISLTDDEGKEKVKMIAKEINLMRKLNHENIVRYLGKF